MYDHKATDQKKALKDQLEDLQKRFEEVLKVTSRHEDTIRFLQYKLDTMGKQMIGAVREMSEQIEYIDDERREKGNDEKMDFENSKTNRKENLDDSYDIPQLNLRALATRAGSPEDINVPRAGSPGYIKVPRAGSPGR